MGGGGVFGRRLVTGLLESTRLDVVLAGRDAARLAALVARRNDAPPSRGRARVASLNLDARNVTADALRAISAFAVMDASGPFQGGDYRLARAAIDAGLHYVDLADARDFVAGFGVLDAAAKAMGVVALTGASSTPALSNAALDALTAGWRRVDQVEIAISPGNRAPRGLSVVRSILSYAGRPVRLFTGGRWGAAPGWGMMERRLMPRVGRRWLSLVETPDLDIVPERFAVQGSAVVRAGLELPVLHLSLWAASLPVRLGLIRSLSPMAGFFRGAADFFLPFGTDRGAMTVAATGMDGEGRSVRGLWSLTAQGGDGPFVPTLPALAALRALASGRLTRPGASACVGVLSLEKIEAEFRGRRITSRLNFARPGPGLYEKILGEKFALLPAPLRRLHRPGWGVRARGMARVDGAQGPIARIASVILRLPPAADRTTVSVDITPVRRGERWVRDFGDRRFASILSASATPGRLVERFGAVAFELDLPVGPRGVLGMPIRAWRVGPLPLPRRLAPISKAIETVDEEGRFCFDVELRLPLRLGRLVRYRGWLTPDEPRPSTMLASPTRCAT
ncbi:MAG: DUF4166 domain-containing protein [Caulobacteraceae bacterium]|nr:DUF4166 domain-containing protein [Caulobacteraceae bacterium]